MAFDRISTKVPTTIGKVEVRLIDDVDNGRSILGRVTVLDQNGEFIREWSGDLRPQLTSAQLTALSNFLDSLRTKATAEFI